MNAGTLWRKVLARDRRWDGRFVYAVDTTGIYCRPSCPSRRPSRRHVRFFADTAEAERAGFRPCRRCGGRPAGRAASLLRQACARLEEVPPDGRLRFVSLARELGISPFQLSRLFRSTLGIAPRDYAEARRLGRLKALLKRDTPVTSALYEAGYGSSSRLYERADAELGMTPGVYRRGGAGMRIRYTVVRSALGWLLVGATERGVCSVKLGDAARPLEEDLRREYPNATIHADLGRLSPAVTSLLEVASGRLVSPGLPIDVQGTAFQRRVWNCLRRIPPGATRSYGEVAKTIGQPGSARAVARACGANHVALLIPCHRVVQADGGLGGYHWGPERKRRLVSAEQALASSRATARALGRARVK
jgi:AraC family transcriptional regulator of adaptative response/methylated-DNA-[protein]-cysteine methyltransferase